MKKSSSHPPPFFECNPAVIFSDTASMSTKEDKWDYMVSILKAWSDIDTESMPHWMFENLSRVRDISSIRSLSARKRWSKEQKDMQMHSNCIANELQNDANELQPSLLFSSLLSSSCVEVKKKTRKVVYSNDSDPHITATFLDETIKGWNKTYKGKTDSEIQSWCDDFDKMTRIDNVTAVRQRCFIAAIHEDEGDGKGFCWRVNITSAGKFRKQYNDGKLVRYETRAKEIFEENFK